MARPKPSRPEDAPAFTQVVRCLYCDQLHDVNFLCGEGESHVAKNR